MTSTEFIAELRDLLHIGDRQVRMDNHNRFNDRYDTVFVHYFNLPEGIGDAGGGAERENNRMLFAINGFGRGVNDLPPSGKIKIETSASSLSNPDAPPGDWRAARWQLRAKTGKSEAIAKYLADFLNKTAAKVPPNFTHTRGR